MDTEQKPQVEELPVFGYVIRETGKQHLSQSKVYPNLRDAVEAATKWVTNNNFTSIDVLEVRASARVARNSPPITAVR